MNYFQKHLGDIAKKTAHLTALEYGVYNLILDAYYDREMGPTLVEATRWARARTEEEKSAVLAVLDEFFTLGEDGRHTQKRVVEEIAAYKAKAEIAQTNGRKGGRPSKNNPDKPSGLSVGSVSVPENNQQETGSKANQEPITNNHKPEEQQQVAVAPGDQDALGSKPVEKPKKRRFTDDDMTTARWMHDQVLKVNATARSPNFDVWADEVRLTREIDGRTHAEICDLFRWAKHDAFWCSNIQSPGKLREKWDQLTEKRARTGQGGSSQAGKFHLAGQDHTSSKNAMAASMALHGTVVPVDGEISFDD